MTSPENAKVLNSKELAFIQLVANEGMPLTRAAKHPSVDIHPVTASKWMKRPDIKEAISEVVEANKARIEVRAGSLIDKAFTTLSNAMSSPSMTPSQVKAAHIILLLAKGSDARDANTGNITVEVHTSLGVNLLEQQQSRHRELSPSVVEGEYTLVTDDA